MIKPRRNTGQTLLEYSVLIIVIVGVFIAMSAYLKRGFQGRWKQAVDDFGDQYDPRVVNSIVVHTRLANSETRISTETDDINGKPGYWTMRKDSVNSIERKEGYMRVGN